MARRKKHKSNKWLAPLDQDRHQANNPDRRHFARPPGSGSYGSLVRRTVMFQIRLAADGLRDLLLSPICVIAALLGLLRPDNPSWALDRLMMMGRQTDRWINLFEQEDLIDETERSTTIDDLFDQMEREVKSCMETDAPCGRERWEGAFSAFAGPKDANR